MSNHTATDDAVSAIWRVLELRDLPISDWTFVEQQALQREIGAAIAGCIGESETLVQLGILEEKYLSLHSDFTELQRNHRKAKETIDQQSRVIAMYRAGVKS